MTSPVTVYELDRDAAGHIGIVPEVAVLIVGHDIFSTAPFGLDVYQRTVVFCLSKQNWTHAFVLPTNLYPTPPRSF